MEAEREEEWVGVSPNERKQCLLGTVGQLHKKSNSSSSMAKDPSKSEPHQISKKERDMDTRFLS